MLQLQLFSLQILHQENIFLAKGFTMDAKLLARVSIQLPLINKNLIIKMYLLFIFFILFLDGWQYHDTHVNFNTIFDCITYLR